LVELGGWDELELAKVLGDLAKDGRELLNGTGYDGDDLDKLLSGDSEMRDLSDNVDSSFEVVVSCASELEQERVYNQLKKEGLTCRVLTL